MFYASCNVMSVTSEESLKYEAGREIKTNKNNFGYLLNIYMTFLVSCYLMLMGFLLTSSGEIIRQRALFIIPRYIYLV